MFKKSKSKNAITFKSAENEYNYSNIVKKENTPDKPNKNKISFMNEEEKEGYCVNRYDNGDSYFGYYANDLRNQNGFYTYGPIRIDYNYLLNRYYFGFWKDDLRNGNGIFLWSKDKRDENFYDSFEKSNFKAYVGIFDSDNLKKGTYLSKEGENYFVYHGTFSENSKKEGKNCFYYSANLEQLFYGTFHDNEFVSGYIAKFNDEGEIDDIIKYYNKAGKDLENNNENDQIKKLMTTFRDCILNEDYFGSIYEVFSRILKFKDEYLFDIDAVNSNKQEDFYDICKSYKKITIFHDIEKYVKVNK